MRCLDKRCTQFFNTCVIKYIYMYVYVCAHTWTQLWPTLCNPMDCSLPGCNVHGISQARILGQVTIPSSRVSSQLRDRTQSFASPALAGRFFTSWATREPLYICVCVCARAHLRMCVCVYAYPTRGHTGPDSLFAALKLSFKQQSSLNIWKFLVHILLEPC